MPALYRRGDHGPPVVEVRDRLARLGLLANPVLGDPAARDARGMRCTIVA